MTRRRTAAPLAVLTVLMGLLVPLALAGPVPPAAAQAAPAPSAPDGCGRASEEAPLLIEVRTLAPRAPERLDQGFQVAGRLVNCGREELRDLEVRLGVGPRLDSRSAVQRADEEPVAGTRRLTRPVQTALQPGGTTGFDLRLPVADLRLGTVNGVFPVTVQVRGRVGEERSRLQVGLAHTFLPWFPDGPIAPTRLAWVLPLVDVPHRGPDEVMLDDALDALLASDPPGPGRLQRVLQAGVQGSVGGCDPVAAPYAGATPPAVATGCRGEAVPMTYAVDPDLLRTVEAMTRPYTELRGGQRTEQPPSADAATWLSALRSAATGDADVLALPYGDPDVVALTSTGSPVKDDVEALRRLGAAEAERLLGTVPLRSVAWVPPGPLGSSVDTLAGGEVRTLLLDAAALPDPNPLLGRTPSARTTLTSVSADVGALVADPALSELLEPDPAGPGWQGTRLAEQRWVAEIAALAAERPSTSRTFVVAPPRRADLDPRVVAGAIADTGRLPFLCPVSLAAAAAGTERCPQGTTGLRDDQGPAQAEPRATPRLRTEDDPELDRQQLQGLGEVRTASDQFTELVLADRDRAKTAKARLLRARGRAASTAWRDDAGAGRRMLRLLAQDVAALRGKVRLLTAPVTLTGNTGTIPLTVQNELDQPVNVGVGLPSGGAARLASADSALQEVPALRAIDVQVRVEARTSGRFTVQARLLDAEGRAFGPPVPLEVRSTQYGRVALAVTGLAAAVLMLAAGLRIIRRATRRPTPVALKPGPP